MEKKMRIKDGVFIRTALAVSLAAMVASSIVACSGGSGSSSHGSSTPSPAPSPTPTPTPVIPSGMQLANINVPSGMDSSPFNKQMSLVIPKGFSIGVFARLSGARFMAVAPNGDLLVSAPSSGKVTLFRPDGKKAGQTYTFASGLRNPHDIVFHTLNGKNYIYIAESNRIIRTLYASGDTTIGTIEPVVSGLPDSSSPELGGTYGHQLKNIALNGGKLYVSIASTCNACILDTQSDPIRNAVYEYDAGGGNRRLYARGLRNAEGVRFKPGTNELWAAVNNRDEIAYPFHQDWDGNGSDDYGKVMPTYVDGHPPDLLVKLRDGGNYGWPFCNSNPDNGLDNMPYDRDVQFNSDGTRLDCDGIDRVTKGIQAHSAPLGMSFLQDSGLPEPYRNAVVVALHGCWDCLSMKGNKVVTYAFRDDGSLGDAADLITGWVTDPAAKQRWGRPVAAVPDGKGSLYISDDMSGTIYLLSSG